MRRRKFLGLVGAGAAWPLMTRAQQAEKPLIGFLHSASASAFAEHIPAFHKGLNEAGYVDGQNVTVEYRWAEGRNETLPALAADLVRRGAAVIVTPISTPATLAAKAATSTICFRHWGGPGENGLLPVSTGPAATPPVLACDI